MPSNLYTNIQQINSVKQNIYNAMVTVNYPITNITPLSNYSGIINNYTRNNDGYIITYDSNITNNLINSGKLFNSDTIVTIDNTEVWCTDDYVVSGRKYYNLQVVNNVTLPRAITGEIKDTTTIHIRSICKYFNSTYARLNFRNGGGITGKWVNYIWDSNDGIHYKLNTSASTANIFNINSPNCLNYTFIYLNGTYDWPLEYFMFDGYKLNLTSIIKINDNSPKTYNFNLTAENVIGGTKCVGMNGVTISNIEKDTIVDKNALLNRVDLYQNVPNFNTSNVTNMTNMFRNCTNLTSVPNYNTSNVTNMCSIFYNCRNLTSVPNFDTRNVTYMYYMFWNCYNLTSVPNFDTSNVTSMSGMFGNCTNLTTLPNFDTRNVTDVVYMFQNCNNLTTVPNFNTSKVINITGMFQDCYNLSDASVQNIINMCLNSGITNTSYKNLNTTCSYSPFRNSNITSDRYSNRLSELTAAGWTY